jgi:hypothetical protein
LEGSSESSGQNTPENLKEAPVTMTLEQHKKKIEN